MPISFAVATMPQWWPEGYCGCLLSGVGYFRVPARYTLFSSLGLAILAGEGFDLAISRARFRVGLASALVFAIAAVAAAVFWTMRPDVHLRTLVGGIAGRVPLGGARLVVAHWSALLAWRFGRQLGPGYWSSSRPSSWASCFITGPPNGDGPSTLPEQSRVLTELAGRSPRGLIGGETGNLPVRLGLKTGHPYLGFAHAPFNRLLLRCRISLFEAGRSAETSRWQARRTAQTQTLAQALACLVSGRLASRDSGAGKGPGPLARPDAGSICHREPVRAGGAGLVDRRAGRAVSGSEGRPARRASPPPSATFSAVSPRRRSRTGLVPGRGRSSRFVPRPRSARLVSWDGSTAQVEHDGPCDLVVARSFDPGWTARINGGPEQRVLRVDGGFQAVRLDGSGSDRVALRYQPAAGGRLWLTISSVRRGRRRSWCSLLSLALHGSGTERRRRGPRPDQGLSFSSSFRMVSIKGPMIWSLKSNRMPAAANSSGSGRDPPSARAFL